ncbi:hypothetical protein V498_08024, partial [Pseudogymnoascus sp. VKM F-4517 (FW-2822)]
GSKAEKLKTADEEQEFHDEEKEKGKHRLARLRDAGCLTGVFLARMLRRKRPPDRALACPGDKKAWPAWWVGEKMATAAATTTSEWVDG